MGRVKCFGESNSKVHSLKDVWQELVRMNQTEEGVEMISMVAGGYEEGSGMIGGLLQLGMVGNMHDDTGETIHVQHSQARVAHV